MTMDAPELPGPDAATFWNGEPCLARQVRVTVADADFPSYWARPFVGQERDAVEVRYLGSTFYLDDEGHIPGEQEREALEKFGQPCPDQVGGPGWGWAKVTLGRGGPRFGHSSLEVDPSSVVDRGHEHDWQPFGVDSWRCECGQTKTAIV